MLTEVPLATYFSMPAPESPFDYAYRGLSIFQMPHFLPGMFVHNLAAKQVNTPLWTISVESTLYLWVAGAGVLRLLRLPWLTSIAIAALFSYLVLLPMSRGQYALIPQLHTTVQGFFGAGAILCLLRKYVRVSSGIMLVTAIVCGLMQRTIHHLPFALLATGYAVLWFSYVPRLPGIPLRADFSYGTYLWGWPVGQTVVMLAHVKAPLALFALTAPIALAIGALSWFCIEKPALRLKDRRMVWPAWMRRLAAKPIAPPEGATGVISVEQSG
jgi:peptidoglycan/LPS O-acetylase OafA/YrhL